MGGQSEHRICFLLSNVRVSNDHDDVSENGKKAIGLDWQNNSSAPASRFFVHFFVVIASYDVRLPNFTFCGGREHNDVLFFS